MKKILFFWMCVLGSGVLWGQVVDEMDKRIFPSENHQTEVHISINKRYSNTILASANTDGKKSSQGFYYSQNDGQTWTGSDEIPNNIKVGGDPVTAFDADGNFYVISMAQTNGANDGYLVFSSNNNGISWNHVRGTGPHPSFDKPMSIFFDDQQSSGLSRLKIRVERFLIIT